MDGLITILILIGVFALKSSRKKKMQQQAARKANAFKDAAESMNTGKKPYAKGEWQDFLAELEGQAKLVKNEAKATMPKPKKPAAAAKPGPAKPAAAVKPRPAPVLHLDHDEPEGTVSTQGETAAEHAAHRSRILEEEAKLEQTRQTLQDLRSLNTRKLRSAVVMSEVLGKPVSLRPRGYR